MIDQELINIVQRYIDNDDDLNPDTTKELLNNYIKLIEDNAELHKVIVKLRKENNELYQESANDKGL